MEKSAEIPHLPNNRRKSKSKIAHEVDLDDVDENDENRPKPKNRQQNGRNNRRTADVKFDATTSFSDMLLSDAILRGLEKSGFKRPSPVQLKAIPLAKCGLDLIVQAKSGTGKTCVFVVVALETVVLSSSGTQVIIVAPTREIACQIYDALISVGQFMDGLKCGCFIGGKVLKEDKVTAKQCHVVVGSPGRICQLIQEGDLSVDGVRLFVLDEADKLIDDGLQDNINFIFSKLPTNKQLLVLSATYPRELDLLLSKYMKNPQTVKLDATDIQLLGLKQYVLRLDIPFSDDWMEQKIEQLHLLLSRVTFSQCLIFCNYQDKVDLVSNKLKDKQWPVQQIGAHMNQTQRLRVIQQLKNFRCRVLVSTDLTARGIDAENVNFVINFDIPYNAETYFHRIGRAGRFGGYGAAVTLFCGWQTELNFFQMAAASNFRAKYLPEDFPLDIVVNEDYFANLPTLEIPDLSLMEQKAAAKKAARKQTRSVAVDEDEDSYNNLAKKCEFIKKRRNPWTYTQKVYALPEDTIRTDCKYDRSTMISILKTMLRVKSEPENQQSVIVNGEKVEEKSIVEQEKNVDGEEKSETVQIKVEIEQIIEKIQQSVEEMSIKNTEIVETSDEKSESEIVTSLLENPFEKDENPSDKSENPSDIGEKLSDKDAVSDTNSAVSQSIDFSSLYYDSFSKSVDDFLCLLYGGFAWHKDRALMLEKSEKPIDNTEKGGSSQYECPEIPSRDAKDSASRTFIRYSRDQMLMIWQQTAADPLFDVKRCDWSEITRKLNIFVERDFFIEENDKNSAANALKEEILEEKEEDEEEYEYESDESEEDNGKCDCWAEYSKMLQKYDEFLSGQMAPGNSHVEIAPWQKYLNEVDKYVAVFKSINKN